MKTTRYFGLGAFLIASALIVPSTIAAQDKSGIKDEKGMMKDEKGMMKDGNDVMMKDKMKSEKKGQAGKTDDKMKTDEKMKMDERKR